jgi:hypothetical protein
MRRLFKTASVVGLILTVMPAFMVYADMIAWRTHAAWMLIGTVLWFATAPFWMVEPDEGSAE